MLKIEKFVTISPEQMEIVIEGARAPMNSWDRMDSCISWPEHPDIYNLGPNDHKLLMSLAKGGPVHAKYRRMIPVWVTINAPLFWWKEADKYQVGTTTNSCSTMHKIHAKEFTLDDFSCEHLTDFAIANLKQTINTLNMYRNTYLYGGEDILEDGSVRTYKAKDKTIWLQMIELLPSSYNQKRVWFGNYEVLNNIYFSRKNHKLDEWHVFCDFIEELPWSELIIGEDTDGK